MRNSRSALLSLSDEDCLDEDVSVMLLGLLPKIWDFQVEKRHDVASFGSKNRRAQDGEGKRGGKNRKNKKTRENRRGERGRRGHCRNKINPLVGENSGSETTVYHHIIY